MKKDIQGKIFVAIGTVLLLACVGKWIICCIGVLAGLWLVNTGLLALHKPSILQLLDLGLNWAGNKMQGRK